MAHEGPERSKKHGYFFHSTLNDFSESKRIIVENWWFVSKDICIDSELAPVSTLCKGTFKCKFAMSLTYRLSGLFWYQTTRIVRYYLNIYKLWEVNVFSCVCLAFCPGGFPSDHYPRWIEPYCAGSPPQPPLHTWYLTVQGHLPASDIWGPSVETCSNLFTSVPAPLHQCWHLVDIEAYTKWTVRILQKCFLVPNRDRLRYSVWKTHISIAVFYFNVNSI